MNKPKTLSESISSQKYTTKKETRMNHGQHPKENDEFDQRRLQQQQLDLQQENDRKLRQQEQKLLDQKQEKERQKKEKSTTIIRKAAGK